jgi:hypothetical protein
MVSRVGSPPRSAAILGGPALVAVVATLLIACTGSAGTSASATAPAAATPSDPGSRPSGPVSIPPSADVVPGKVPAALLERIVADAAAVAKVAPADVVVVSTESVTWNDGSLGCPKPGVSYIQMIIEGYRVIVEAGGQRYDYRAGSSGDPKRCEGSLPSGGNS